MPTQRIALFGGSFDPIHVEHVRLAKDAVQSLGLDLLIVLPAGVPPHKRDKVLSAETDRLEMCRRAFDGEEKIIVSDYEIRQGGTSYTYLTCRHFKQLYPKAELFWLVGTDMLRDFPTWKNPEQILQAVTLAVCARNEEKNWLQTEQEAFYARFQKQFVTIDYQGKDISSTTIRTLLAAGEDVTPLIGERVAEYIRLRSNAKGTGLYQISGAEQALSLQKPNRRAHSIRVALLAAKRAKGLKIPESKAITAALFHDCAKNLTADSPYLNGFSCEKDVPSSVVHQFSGAYVAENTFQIQDEEILDAIRYHTSGRANMTELGKLIFLSDMVEEERNYDGVEILRKLFWQGNRLDECLLEALSQTLQFLRASGREIYSLTQAAYDYYQEKLNNKE